MSPRTLLFAVAGLAALGLAGLVGGWALTAAVYRAAWLALLALPLGALPLVLAFDRVPAQAPLRPALHRLLALMPAAALLALPVLVTVPLLGPLAPAAGPETPLARVWLMPGLVIARLVAALVLWLWLCARAGRLGGRGAALALVLHAVLATLVAIDLVTALDPRLASTLLGVLIQVAWSGSALAAALLIARAERPDGLTALAVLLALWAFLHFVQFLVVWSANLPAEVAWYLARGGLAGRGLAVCGGLVVVLGAALTLRPGPAATRVLAGLVLGLHAAEMLWFVTPALRGGFTLGLTEILGGLGFVGLALASRPAGRRASA